MRGWQGSAAAAAEFLPGSGHADAVGQRGRSAASRCGLVGVTFVLANGAQFPPLDLNFRSTRASNGPTRALRDRRFAHRPGEPRRHRDACAARQVAARDDRALCAAGQLTRRVDALGRGRAGVAHDDREGPVRRPVDRCAARCRPGGQAGTPGFERLSGSVDLDHGAAALKLASRNAVARLPGRLPGAARSARPVAGRHPMEIRRSARSPHRLTATVQSRTSSCLRAGHGVRLQTPAAGRRI